MSNFKIGDRVVYNQTLPGQQPLVPNGSVGTVVRSGAKDNLGIEVEFDHEPSSRPRAPFACNLSPFVQPKTRLQSLMDQYKETRALHAKAATRTKLANEEQVRLAQQLNKDRQAVLNEMETITKPE